MVQTVLAYGDFVTAIPNFWNSIRIPVAILMVVVGAVSAIASLHHGFAKAAGKLLGGIALGAIAISAVALLMSAKTTVDNHGGGTTTGQYGGL